jgi:hypothetical protein
MHNKTHEAIPFDSLPHGTVFQSGNQRFMKTKTVRTADGVASSFTNAVSSDGQQMAFGSVIDKKDILVCSLK